MNSFTGYQALRLDRNVPDHDLRHDLGEALDALRAVSSMLLEQEHPDDDVVELLRCSRREAERARCLWQEYESRRQSAK